MSENGAEVLIGTLVLVLALWNGFRAARDRGLL